MTKLTKVEEEIMQYVWKLTPCTVSDVIAEIQEPKPPHSTISSIVRILEKKGFVTHKAYGRTHVYTPAVSKEVYRKRSLQGLMGKYFDGSPKALVSFLVKEENLSLAEIQNLIDDIKGENHG